MCLITFQWQAGSDTKLILSANRDEFLHRPALEMHPWKEEDGVYAGKDLSQGGTWLGVQKNGRFAALTNHRDMRAKGPKDPSSRGNLVLDFLTSNLPTLEYLQALEQTAHLFAGYNLIVCDGQQLAYFSNKSGQAPTVLESGVYGLSNGLLNDPWPKVELAKQQLNQWLAIDDFSHPPTHLLSSTEIADDSLLPDTGIGLDMERVLSCQKIITPNYGTRCSTGIIFSRSKIQIEEISWHANGEEINHEFHDIHLID